MKIQTNVNTLKALLVTAGKRDVRFYLNAVHIDLKRDTCLLVSTDGHRLTAIDTFITKPEGFAVEEMTLPRDILDAFVKSAGKGEIQIEIIDKGNVKLSSSNGVAMEVGALECTYPNWRKVLDIGGYTQNEEQVRGMPVNCRPEYLADLAKIYKLMVTNQKEANNTKEANSIIWHNSDKQAVMMTLEENTGFLSIVMGMGYSKTKAVPPSELSSAFK